LRSFDFAQDFGTRLRRRVNASSSSPVPGTSSEVLRFRLGFRQRARD
jgi:hypothetical protein